MSRRRSAWLIFFACLFIYNANLRYTGSFDSLAASRLPFRLLTGHGLTLHDPTTGDRATGVPENVRYSYWKDPKGRWIDLYPVLTPLLVTPLYFPAALLERSRPYLEPRGIEVAMEKLSASIIAAFSAVLLFLTLRKITRPSLATWLTVGYAFGTSTWSVSSQALWQHGTGELLLCLALYLLADEIRTAPRLALLGAVAGLLAANRPTDALFSAALAAIVLRERRAGAWPFFAAAAPIAILLAAYNLTEFGVLSGGYARFSYPDSRPFGLGPFRLSGLAGLLFSNRGLFVFSPFLLLFFLRRWNRGERIRGLRTLLFAYLASLFLHGLAIDWMGGYCYGPRYAIHGLPVLVAALAQPLEQIWKLAAGRVAFVACVAFSIVLQAVGAFFYPNGDSGEWHHGLWTIRNSSPMLALRAGPALPDYLFLLTPGVPTRFRLTPEESACRLEWATRPPASLRAGQSAVLRIRVTNLGTKHWSSLGGPFNAGGVKIRSVLLSGGEPLEYSATWLAWRLDPGRSVEREATVTLPATTSPVEVSVDLVQDRIDPFPRSTCSPLRADVTPTRDPQLP